MEHSGRIDELISSGSLPRWEKLETWLREGLTKSAGLRMVDSLGATTSSAQFDELVERGVLRKEENGKYPADTLDKLLRFHDLGKTPGYFSLARRIVLLRSEPLFWYIPAETMRASMTEVAKTMSSPARKMKRVEKALAVWASYPAQSALFSLGPGVPIGWRPPDRAEWPTVLNEEPELFENRYGMSYGTAMNVLPAFVRGTQFDLASIPVEEQVVLLTVRDLAAIREMRRLARQAEARRQLEVMQATQGIQPRKGLLESAKDELKRKDSQ
jgi:hypothetical protein